MVSNTDVTFNSTPKEAITDLSESKLPNEPDDMEPSVATDWSNGMNIARPRPSRPLINTLSSRNTMSLFPTIR
jgi:hypothetical protein